MMRRGALATMLLLQACASPRLAAERVEPRPTLPPVRRVSLAIENAPLHEAIERFAKASGFGAQFVVLGSLRGWEESEIGRTPFTMRCRAMPWVQALTMINGSFCVTGNGVEYSPILMACRDPMSFTDLVGALAESVEEHAEDGTCHVRVRLWWQPDLRVFEIGETEVTEAVDDLGNDLLLVPPSSAAMTLARPPRGATRLARVRGTFTLLVPGDCEECTITDLVSGQFITVTDGGSVLRVRKEVACGVVAWSVSTEASASTIDFIEAVAVSPQGTPIHASHPTAFWNGRLEATFAARSFDPVQALRFKIVRNKAILRVPFEFTDIPLER